MKLDQNVKTGSQVKNRQDVIEYLERSFVLVFNWGCKHLDIDQSLVTLSFDPDISFRGLCQEKNLKNKKENQDVNHIEIIINPNLAFLDTVLHELTHVKQYLDKRLHKFYEDQKFCIKWENQNQTPISPDDYFKVFSFDEEGYLKAIENQPWEIEAKEQEAILLVEFLKSLDRHSFVFFGQIYKSMHNTNKTALDIMCDMV